MQPVPAHLAALTKNIRFPALDQGATHVTLDAATFATLGAVISGLVTYIEEQQAQCLIREP